MPVETATERRPRRHPAAIRLGIAGVLPFSVALTLIGTYLNHEVVVAAMWVAGAMLAALFLNPIIGVVGMTAMFLLAAYPTPLRELGLLTLNNLLGVGLAVLLVARTLETRDLSFLKSRQLWVLVAIGLGFLVATQHARLMYPLLQPSRGRIYMLDRTATMGHDFVARLAFLVFLLAFVRTRRDLGALFLTLMLGLYLAVPSALVNWMQGELNRGFRAAASVTVGANPNRLAMICLIEIACWWFWLRARPERWRRLVAAGAIGASMVVLLATGSRSGLLGCGVLVLALQLGRRRYRVPARQIALGCLAATVLVLAIVPAADWQRMTALFPEEGAAGASSSRMREETLWMATRMVRDHPVLGIGLGNFREVSRQVYRDRYYRPPHNSFLWAGSEGGLVVLSLYLLLLWTTWRDLRVVARLADRDPTLGHVVPAVRVVFLLYVFFAFFADLFLSPITYVLIGLVACMRRYVEGLPEARTVALGRRPVLPAAAPA
jgi:hypothetical protein